MKSILIVIDMQSDFIDGSLGTAEALAIAPAVSGRISRAKEEGWEVIFTRDTHGADYLDTPEGKNLPVEHCIQGSGGWALYGEIAAQANGYRTFDKPTFGSTALAEALRDELGAPGKGSAIELCGVCTDICVVSNALIIKAYLPEADISVNPALCAGVTPDKHLAALEVMRSCQIRIL